MFSYAVDVWVDDASILTDEVALPEILRGAVASGDAVVLGDRMIALRGALKPARG